MATDGGVPWRESAGGLTVTVRLTPRGGQDRLDGLTEVEGRPALRARVAAAPVDGAANRALVRLLAKAVGVAPSAVEITGGASSRIKQVRLAGDPEAIGARLAGLV